MFVSRARNHGARARAPWPSSRNGCTVELRVTIQHQALSLPTLLVPLLLLLLLPPLNLQLNSTPPTQFGLRAPS